MGLGMSGLTPAASRALGQVTVAAVCPSCPWAAGHDKEDPKEADFFQPYAS